MKKWWIYIVKCSDGSLYCGTMNDLNERLAKHNEGKGAKYTRSRRPVVLMWAGTCENRSEACCYEANIKELPRMHKLNLVKECMKSPAGKANIVLKNILMR